VGRLTFPIIAILSQSGQERMVSALQFTDNICGKNLKYVLQVEIVQPGSAASLTGSCRSPANPSIGINLGGG
jgi:hypothetical protein